MFRKLVVTLLFTTLFVIPVSASTIEDFTSDIPENVSRYLDSVVSDVTVVESIESDYIESSWDIMGLTTVHGSVDDISYLDIQVRHYYEFTIQHEYGHCIDCYGGKLYAFSDTEEFINIYNREKNNNFVFTSGFNYNTNSHEYFAEAFHQYISNPNMLKFYNPYTYAYMSGVVKSIK